jgi:hypothetical protein
VVTEHHVGAEHTASMLDEWFVDVNGGNPMEDSLNGVGDDE